jgi:antitoxin (DNA-binding transcriptional repressor) of toxin-antitoxin stability system
MTLERACEVQMEVGRTHPAMKRAMLDYLLCGRGTLWERYEPTFGEPQDLGPGDAPGGDDDDNAATQDAAGSTSLTEPEGGQEQAAPVRPVTFEKVNTDYVAWDKFRHSPAAQWDEVWWVSKDEMLTRKELRDRFKGVDEESGKPIADLIPMRANARDKEDDREKKRRNPRALVVEIWNKRDRKVIFIAPDWPNAPLEIAPDPLSLQNFFPVPGAALRDAHQ